jgi:pimeloyl-ACP methyl ester carboxylesterase
MSVLADRLLAVRDALDSAGIAHAFGGAIALAYCTQEPRGTRDLDVNVFVSPERAEFVLDSLPSGVTVRPADRVAARRDGQVRVMWDDTPLDLFFNTHAFYRSVAGEVAVVPFEATTIPVLGCEALAVFKAMYGRTRDWADLEAMLEAGAFDCSRALERLRELVGGESDSVVRLAGMCSGL